MTRPDVSIPKSPQTPYPVTERHVTIVAGFGRGSAELGIPTANVSTQEVKAVTQLEPGVYFGWAKVHKKADVTHSDVKARESGKQVEYSYGLGLTEGKDLEVVLPTVMSIGWNPFYGNKEKAIELHIVHEFPQDFYGATVSFNVLGYIRPELNYTTKGMYNGLQRSAFNTNSTQRGTHSRHSKRYRNRCSDTEHSRIQKIPGLVIIDGPNTQLTIEGEISTDSSL